MATKKIYWTYRPWLVNFTARPSFFLMTQFKDYFDAGWLNIRDEVIQDANYTATLPSSSVLSMEKFMVIEYDDTKTTDVFIGNKVGVIGQFLDVKLFETAALAKAWVIASTNLVESPANSFLTAPATYLVID